MFLDLGKMSIFDVDVGFSFCLVLIVWLKQVQDLRNRTKFLLLAQAFAS